MGSLEKLSANWSHKPLIEILDYQKIKNAFLEELAKSSKGEKTSISFIQNILPQKPLITEGIVQGIVIGGSVYQDLLIHLHGSEKNSIRQQKKLLPLFSNKKIFLNFLGQHIAEDASAIGISFAYPLEPVFREDAILDGILITGTKEHIFDGLTGELVGKTIEEHLQKTRGKKIKVSVANDTVGLALSGLQQSLPPETLAGGIVGTGQNFGFFLDNNTVVNTEAGGFSGFTPTSTGKDIDKKSSNKGKQLLEKEISGEYLYQHFNALQEKLHLQKNLSSTEELTSIAASGNNTDVTVAQELFRRSASLVASEIAAIYEFKRRPEKMNFIMEGSVFWKGWYYKELVTQQLKNLDVPDGAITFLHIENSSLLGAISLITR